MINFSTHVKVPGMVILKTDVNLKKHCLNFNHRPWLLVWASGKHDFLLSTWTSIFSYKSYRLIDAENFKWKYKTNKPNILRVIILIQSVHVMDLQNSFSTFLVAMEDIRPIVSVESSVESIAVDWNLRILFWLESYPRARLRTSSLSGRRVTTLLSSNLYSPISLTIDSTEG